MISDSAIHEFFLNMRHAMVIWMLLIGLAVAGFVLLAAVSRQPLRRMQAIRRRWVARRARKRAQRATPPRPSPQAQARELRRYAEEVAVAAGRAGVMAERRHADWVAVQRTQEAAWRAYEVADEAARRVDQAALFPALTGPDGESIEPGESPRAEVPLSASELAARRRYLHRAATEAHERGELSAEQLSDALFDRNGWDPTLHPFEQQKMLRHVARDRLLRAYQEAAVIERSAWHAYEVSAAAKQSLEDEAFRASLRARAQSRLASAKRHRYLVRVATS